MTSKKGTKDLWEKYANLRWSADKPGDKIAGTLTEVREEDGLSGELPVLTFKTADGESEVWAGQVQLQSQLAKHAPTIGDWVEIELVELRNTGKGNPMKVFTVSVTREGEAF